MFCTGCGTALAASERFCPQCGRPRPAVGAGAQSQPVSPAAPPVYSATPVPPAFQPSPPVLPAFQPSPPVLPAFQPSPPVPTAFQPGILQVDRQQAAAQARHIAGQAEQAAGRAGQFLQGAQAKLAEQAFVQQAAAKLDQIAIPGLQSSTGTTTRDYIWSGITLLITVLGVSSAPFLHLILALVVGAVAVLLGVRTGVNPVWRALSFTLAGGLVAFALPADPILLTGIALSARGAWGIVKELFPAEGPRLQGLRAKYLWSGLGIATLGLCFQWTRRESSYWVSFSTLTRSNEYSPGTNLYGLGQKMTTHTSTWGGESAAGYIFFLIGLGLLLYFTQGKRWTFGWQVGLTLLVWPLALVWMQGFTSYLGLGLIIYSIGIAVALRGLLGDRMPWPKRFR